jgi:hypothetical protein
MTEPTYGFAHRARVLRAGEVDGTYLVELPALAPGLASGPFPSTVRDLAPGDAVLVLQMGLTRGDLVIVGRLPERAPDVTLPIGISDVTGLAAALDAAATDTDLAALAATIDTRDDGQDATLTSHGTRLTTVEGRATTLEGRATTIEGVNTTQDGRLTAVEGVNTTQNTRLTTAETNITTLQARKAIRIARPNANAPLWTSTLTTGANTTYVVAQVAIPDPGWAYFIEGMANFTVSGVTGGPYSSSVHMRVDNAANPSAPGTDLLGSNFMRTIDGGFATFQVDGVSQQSWTGARTVYLILRNGATGVMTIGNLSTSLMYRFDLIIHPV